MSTSKVMGFAAQSSVPTTTIQFIGKGSNLLFYGGETRTRYYFSTGDIAQIPTKDADMFLKLKQQNGYIFKKIEEENVKSAIEAGDIMADLQEVSNPNTPAETTNTEIAEVEVPEGDTVDQTGFTEDSEPVVENEDELPTDTDEDGNEEVVVKEKKPRKSKKAKDE